MMSLLADFDRYLQKDEIDFARDGLGYRQTVINLSPEELGEFAKALQGAMQSVLQLHLTKKPRRFLFSIISMSEHRE
jgi:hypothetical protein